MSQHPSPSADTAASGTGERAPRQRSTPQKAAVNRALDELDDFISAQELFQVLRDRGEKVSLATVYRTLQQQADEGLVDTLSPDDAETLYRRCAVEDHHHHLVCRRCGRTVEIMAPAVETWAAQVAAEHGFTAVEHTVEIYGLCSTCSAASTTASSGSTSGS